MTYIAYVLAFVGLVVSIVSAVAFVLNAIEIFRDWRHAPHQRSFYEGMEDVRNRLRSDSWWFSESPETQELLADLAQGKDVSSVREKWRKAREAIKQDA